MHVPINQSINQSICVGRYVHPFGHQRDELDEKLQQRKSGTRRTLDPHGWEGGSWVILRRGLDEMDIQVRRSSCLNLVQKFATFMTP